MNTTLTDTIVQTHLRARVHILYVTEHSPYFEKTFTPDELSILATPEGLEEIVTKKQCTITLPNEHPVTLRPLDPTKYSSWSRDEDGINLLSMSGSINYLSEEYIGALRSLGWELKQAKKD